MTEEQTIYVPDIGGANGVDVIEIMVQPGEEIKQDTPLVTLESDKASMEIPSPTSGKVVALLLKVGDKVSQGSPLLKLMTTDSSTKKEPESNVVASVQEMAPSKEPVAVAVPSTTPESLPQSDSVYAGPAVRRLARELSLDLSVLTGSGRKSRITREDVLDYFKSQVKTTGVGGVMPVQPAIDFSQFGATETISLNKIKRLTAQHMHRSWVSIPHVTQFDEVDITALEAFRQEHLKEAEKGGYKLTLLAFIVKALTKVLAIHPQFNASLSSTGEQLIYKQYYNIGIAVDTPNGLMVPVIKGADQLSVNEIAKEMNRLSTVSRDKGLMPGDLQGGSFTVSSLGGIGGTAFTPIVNAPEVAILGLSRSSMKPIYDGKTFAPRLMLPLSLSYDHRVIDGAEAARFMRDLGALISDIRRILL